MKKPLTKKGLAQTVKDSEASDILDEATTEALRRIVVDEAAEIATEFYRDLTCALSIGLYFAGEEARPPLSFICFASDTECTTVFEDDFGDVLRHQLDEWEVNDAEAEDARPKVEKVVQSLQQLLKEAQDWLDRNEP
jgi:hypothetical protein